MRRTLLKFAIFLSALTSVATLFTACGSNGGNNSTPNGPAAVAPLDTRCMNGTANCWNTGYSNYSGWTNYQYPYGTYNGYNYLNYFSTNGFCGCPAGYSPAYNNSMGLGCVSNQSLLPIYNYAIYFNFRMGYSGWVQNGASINIPQVSNISNTTYQGQCLNQISQSCFVNQPNSCMAGATCRQVNTSSNLGICINPYQNTPTIYNFNGGYGFNYGFGGGYYGRW